MVKRADYELAVFEGKWWDDQNTSVRSMFDLLMDVLYGSPHHYYFEMFAGPESLQGMMQRVGAWQRIRYIYIGSHGSRRGVWGSLDKGGEVRVAELAKMLSWFDDQRGVALHGVFLGTCSLLTRGNAKKLLWSRPPEENRQKPLWVAGYSQDVDWIDSTLLDMFFMRMILDSEGTPVQRINEACAEVQVKMMPLADHLGFSVYRRSREDRDLGVVDLLRDVDLTGDI